MRANGGGGDLRGGSSPDLLPMAAYKPHPPQMHGMLTSHGPPSFKAFGLKCWRLHIDMLCDHRVFRIPV